MAAVFRLVIRLQTDLDVSKDNSLLYCFASIEGNGHTVYLNDTYFIMYFLGSYIKNIKFKFIKNTEYIPILSATSTVLSTYKKDNYDITFENISVDYGTTNITVKLRSSKDLYVGSFINTVSLVQPGSTDTEDAVKNSTLIIKNVKIINTPTIILKMDTAAEEQMYDEDSDAKVPTIYVGSIVGYYVGWNKARISGCTDTVKVQNDSGFDLKKGGVIGIEMPPDEWMTLYD